LKENNFMTDDSQEAWGSAYFEALGAAREASAEAAAKAAFYAAEAAYQESK
jgi:hypothetical protein